MTANNSSAQLIAFAYYTEPIMNNDTTQLTTDQPLLHPPTEEFHFDLIGIISDLGDLIPSYMVPWKYISYRPPCH